MEADSWRRCTHYLTPNREAFAHEWPGKTAEGAFTSERSPLPFIGGNISFRASPPGLYLTRSKSFPYYLLAIVHSAPLDSSQSSRSSQSSQSSSLLRFSPHIQPRKKYTFWRPSKPYPLWCSNPRARGVVPLSHSNLQVSFFLYARQLRSPLNSCRIFLGI